MAGCLNRLKPTDREANSSISPEGSDPGVTINIIGHVGDDSCLDMISKFSEDELMDDIPKDSQAQISMALNNLSGRRDDTHNTRTNGFDAYCAFGSGSFSHCLLLYHLSQRFDELPLEIPSNKLLN